MDGDRLSASRRGLLGAAAALFGALGAVLFLAPGWSAPRFPWKVSEFVVMTIGGWSLGTAGFAVVAARDGRWAVVHPCVVFLGAFSALELGVVLRYADLLRTDVVLTWPYLLALVAGLVAAGVTLAGAGHDLRPPPRGGPTPRWVRVLAVGFVALVTFLGAVAFWAPPFALDGRVFPEPMSPFTLRAFGVFYLALGVAGLWAARARGLDPVLAFMRAGLTLVVPILAAAIAYLDRFDLARHPVQSAYLAAYCVAAVGATAILLDARARGVRAPGAADDTEHPAGSPST